MESSEVGRRIQIVGAALLGLTVVLLVVAQFVPWHSFQFTDSVMGMSFETHGTAALWSGKVGAGNTYDETDWFQDDAKGDSGVQTLRVAAILVTSASAVLVAGLVMMLLDQRWKAGLVLAAGAAALIVGTISNASGADAWVEGVQVTRSTGLWLAVFACVLSGVGAFIAFLPHPGLRVREGLLSLGGNEQSSSGS